jgi:hypothetical protein
LGAILLYVRVADETMGVVDCLTWFNTNPELLFAVNSQNIALVDTPNVYFFPKTTNTTLKLIKFFLFTH